MTATDLIMAITLIPLSIGFTALTISMARSTWIEHTKESDRQHRPVGPTRRNHQ